MISIFYGRQKPIGEGQISDVTNNNINSYNVDTQHILDFNNTTQDILSVNTGSKKDEKFYDSKSCLLNILTFNCKNIKTCGLLFKELEKKVDLYLIQEHLLFDCQLDLLNEIHNDYIGIGKAVDSNDSIPPIQMPRGYGGVTILWRKELDSLITPLKIGNERIQCVETQGNPNTLVVSLYLPCKSSNNHFSELCECIDQLHEILERYESTHHIIIGGDFNENILSTTHSNRKNYITSFMNDHQLLSKEIGTTYIHVHPSGNASSAIDYILQQMYMTKTTKTIY
jgi:hypothetical protein